MRLTAVQEETAAMERDLGGPSGPERKYKLGQRVKHAELGYDGVICGQVPLHLVPSHLCNVVLTNEQSRDCHGAINLSCIVPNKWPSCVTLHALG